MSFIAVYITHSSAASAKKVCDHLLEKKLVACANLFPITSAYWWQGVIENESEYVSLVKTTHENWEPLKTAVEKIHPYEVPCIMKMEVSANDAYEAWIREQVAS